MKSDLIFKKFDKFLAVYFEIFFPYFIYNHNVNTLLSLAMENSRFL